MNVSNVTDPSSLYAASGVSSTSSANDASQVGASFDAGRASEVSPMADLMNQLKELQQSDPAKFKKAMAEIADKLKAEAKDATGDQAERLNALADKFSQAGQSGDLSVLKPPSHAGHHRGGHAAYVAAASQQSQQPGSDLSQVIQSTLDDVSAA